MWSSKNPYNQSYTSSVSSVKKTLKKLYGPFFMDGVQLPQGWSHFEAVYFLPLSPQKFLVLFLSASEGWKAESTLEPPSGFEHGPLDWESSTLTTRPLLIYIHLFLPDLSMKVFFYFLSVIWLPHDHLWAIKEGTALRTWC